MPSSCINHIIIQLIGGATSYLVRHFILVIAIFSRIPRNCHIGSRQITCTPSNAKPSRLIANRIFKFTQGWTIGYDKSFSIKDIEFGGSGSGTVSYSTTEGVASTYNSTKIEDYFNVRFNFKDLAYETSTQEQQNLAYNQCSFYTGVSYYGLPSVMEEYSHNSSYKVVFSGYYVRANPFGNTSVDLVPGSATATENLNYVYYTY